MPYIQDGPHEPNKLVLCFDGTGNTFSGNSSDTNVVKILNKLDRHHPKQYHYYQTGVGTYDANATSVNKSWIGGIRSSFSKTIDQAIGTTFDSHVMAGYRFLMRYYEPGDKIYMFGFSRGAFTAKFLARMIHTVGLLCKGNEEMVPFAYDLYQRYLAGERLIHGDTALADLKNDHKAPTTNGDVPNDNAKTYNVARNEIIAFSSTFCRQEPVKDSDGNTIEESNVKVYFLGLWDCVNSVAVLEQNSPMPVPVKGTAVHVRHAVAIDERRVKFKPALIAQDLNDSKRSAEDIKEVWFPGCHGDVGGGWPAPNLKKEKEESTVWSRLRRFWRSVPSGDPTENVRDDGFQMSDVALSWMIRELELIGLKDELSSVKWSKNVVGYKKAYTTNKKQALQGFIHDSLTWSSGTGFAKVLLWKFMEFLPFITRWELNEGKWKNTRFPLNKGSYRDIPPGAELHESVIYRLQKMKDIYCPGNNNGGDSAPCLLDLGRLQKINNVKAFKSGHETYLVPAIEENPKRRGRVSTFSV